MNKGLDLGEIQKREALLREVMTRETVSLMRAGEMAGVSRRTIYNWLADGKIQGVRNAGGAIRIFSDTLFKEVGTLSRKNFI